MTSQQSSSSSPVPSTSPSPFPVPSTSPSPSPFPSPSLHARRISALERRRTAINDMPEPAICCFWSAALCMARDRLDNELRNLSVDRNCLLFGILKLAIFSTSLTSYLIVQVRSVLKMAQILAMTNIKIAFLGSIGSGKSSLIHRIIHNEFKENIMSTVVLDLEIWHRLNHISVYFYDVGNAYTLNTLIDNIVQEAQAYIVVFDITDSQSYVEAIKTLEEYCNRFPDAKFYLLGNKTDLGAVIKREQIQKHLQDRLLQDKVDLHMVSAKNPEYGNITDTWRFYLFMDKDTSLCLFKPVEKSITHFLWYSLEIF